MEDEDLEGLIRYYFVRGFQYVEIIQFLSKYHGKVISQRTLHRRLREYGLNRRTPRYDIDEIEEEVRELLDGPECLVGYRHIWHTLRRRGIQVPRIVVQELMQYLDPEGCELRRAHRLRRRVFHNAGPNAVWHVDGYDKLKPYGFPIHGCIDGWSRKVLWLVVTRSNNYPDNIASYYLEAVEQYRGCPVELDTDLGTENGTMAAIQAFFRDDEHAHRFVSSPRNQRIEGYWSFYRRNNSTWWINFFQDLIHQNHLNTSDPLETECLWFCFAQLLQNDLDKVREHWNTHRIRQSRCDTIPGRPDALFYLPELQGGAISLSLPVPEREIRYARDQLVENAVAEEYQQYFQYVRETNHIRKPAHWREALQLYHYLLQVAR